MRSGTTIGVLLDQWKGKVPGFNAMRFIAASAVLFSHSFGAGENRQHDEWIRQLTGKFELGTLGVYVFFFISGFVITQSCLRSNARSFLIKRIARIMPGLVLVTAFSALVLGPLLTTLPLRDYFHDPKFSKFFLNCLFVLTGELPGLFVGNPSGDWVNVSLWTLRFEVMCYLVVLVTILLLKKSSPLAIAVLALGLVALGYPTCMTAAIEPIAYLRSSLSIKIDITYLFVDGMSVVPFFFVGSLFYFARDRIQVNLLWFTGSIVAMIVIILYAQIYPLFPFALGYAILCLAFYDNAMYGKFSRNDYSYGIYVFAFPMQQTVVTFFPSGMTWWANALLAYPLTLGLAALSWHFVEHPCLRLGSRISGRLKVPLNS
ncbi:Peptidoglycan/LPS O-acetylase OafA/YrhL, contains acyltransferase and SGNH-hydrolase domains [Bradyrhizobium sp. Rc2d]|uniref:acyltransferase family protein n=1 Tax=Bradyrhizobium sp. Rc2d TaxID=1855321 RepID=UPI000882405A|nr:acyltransferase [Bradyrhizobium sp. Rc2d]SDG38292.1 Peptidoglycan/LPS O-acetylase OafA/YrhL, contains acyltransferase and SGNH-hydrolase domains [Bradyrhizobium sp. Rc2d]